jgi:hypothetical protein
MQISQNYHYHHAEYARGLEDLKLEIAEHDNDHSNLNDEIYNVVRDFSSDTRFAFPI